MPAPLSNESRALLRLLADGHWHDLEAIKQQLAGHVPPGRAMRNYEARAASRYQRIGRGPLVVPHDEDKLASGRNTLVGAALHSMGKRHIETQSDPLSGAGRVRIRPEILAELSGQPAPSGDDPPEPGSAPLPVSELTADDVRALVADAVEEALDYAFDEFQAGMQRYLDRNFAELARVCSRRRPHRGPPPQQQQQQGRGGNPQQPRGHR